MRGDVNHPPKIRAVVLVHQEGALALAALVGLTFTERGILGGLASRGPASTAVAVGLGAGLTAVGLMWVLRGFPPLSALESWQRRMVSGWTRTDAVAVAVLSGVAEEALLRAFLQPMIGLVPAAALFAVLHLVPDRRLWVWPVFALVAGLLLGVLFERFGYPAAAIAHVVINTAGLLRLSRPVEE